MRDFFTEGIFSPGISLQNFFPLKSVCTIFFFWNHPYPPAPPLKSQMVGQPLNIPGIGIQNVIEVQKKNCSLLLDVNRSSQRTFKVRKSCVSQKRFPSSSSFYFMWSLPYGPMKDLHQQTVKREKEWGGGVGMNEREWASLTTKLSDFGHR